MDLLFRLPMEEMLRMESLEQVQLCLLLQYRTLKTKIHQA